MNVNIKVASDNTVKVDHFSAGDILIIRTNQNNFAYLVYEHRGKIHLVDMELGQSSWSQPLNYPEMRDSLEKDEMIKKVRVVKSHLIDLELTI